MIKSTKNSKSIDKTIDDLEELLKYQNLVLTTADKLVKTKDYLIEVLELEKEVYIKENKILRITCLSLFVFALLFTLFTIIINP